MSEDDKPNARTISGALQILEHDTSVGFVTGAKIGQDAAVEIDAAVSDKPHGIENRTFGEALIFSTGASLGLVVGAAVGVGDVAKQALFPPKDPTETVSPPDKTPTR